MESADKNTPQNAGPSSQSKTQVPERSVTFLDKGMAKVMKVSKGHKVIIVNNENGEQDFIAIPESQDIGLAEVLSLSAGTGTAAMPPPPTVKKVNNSSWQPAYSSTQVMSQDLSPIKPLSDYLNNSLEVLDEASENVQKGTNQSKNVSLNERNDWLTFKPPPATQVTSEPANTENHMEVDHRKDDVISHQEVQQTLDSLTSTLAHDFFVPETQSQSMVNFENTVLPTLPVKVANPSISPTENDSGDSEKLVPTPPEAQPIVEQMPEEPEKMEETIEIDLSLPPEDAQIWKDLQEITKDLERDYFNKFEEKSEEIVEKPDSSDVMTAPKSQKVLKRKPMPKSKRQAGRTRSRTILDSDFDSDSSRPMLKHFPRI